MARLPLPGSDDGTWGAILNDYLAQAHDGDGTLRAGSVTGGMIATGAVSTQKLDPAAVSSLTNRANHTGTQPAASISGLATIATTGSFADLAGTASDAQLPSRLSASELDTKVTQAADSAVATRLAAAPVLQSDRPVTVFIQTTEPTTWQDNDIWIVPSENA